MDLTLPELWTAGGVLLGFQLTAFGWRIAQEAKVGSGGDIVWLPPADYLNLLAMSTTSLGVFVLPVLGMGDFSSAKKFLGLAALLLIGHSAALAGHYELYNPRTPRSFDFFPLQERIAVGLAVLAGIAYSLLAWGAI